MANNKLVSRPAVARVPTPQVRATPAPLSEPKPKPQPTTVTLNYSGKRSIRYTLEGDTIIKLTGANDGDIVSLFLAQDKVGGHVADYDNVENGHILGGDAHATIAQLLLYDAGQNTFFAQTMGD